MHLPTKVNSWFMTTYLAIKHNYYSDIAYPEVVGVHVQFLRMEVAQFSIRFSNVVQVIETPFQSVKDNNSMSSYHLITDNGGGVIQVSKVTKVPLCPWVHNQASEKVHI